MRFKSLNNPELYKITGAQDIRHQAKMNAVRDRIIEACNEFKTFLAERIYFVKYRGTPTTSWKNNGTLGWEMHPSMTSLKASLDGQMSRFKYPNDIRLDMYNTKGTNLVKQYWVIHKLISTHQNDLNEENVKLSTLESLKNFLNMHRNIFELPTDNIGFFKLDHQTGESSFSFFQTIFQLLLSLFIDPPGQRFFKGATNVNIDAPKEGIDMRYSCLSNKDGEQEVNYFVSQIY